MIETVADTHLDLASSRPELQGNALAYSRWRVGLFGLDADDAELPERAFRAVMGILETQAMAASRPFTVRGRLFADRPEMAFFVSAMDDEHGLQDSSAVGLALTKAFPQASRQDPRLARILFNMDYVAAVEELPRLDGSAPRTNRTKP